MKTLRLSKPSLRTLFTTLIAASAAGVALSAVPTPLWAASHADASSTASAWQANVEKQINANLQVPTGAFSRADHATAEVRVKFDADGALRGIQLAQSTGDAALDKEALRTARAVRFPLLPAELRGRNCTVMMQVYFADGTSAEHDRDAAALTLAAHRSLELKRVQTAALQK